MLLELWSRFQLVPAWLELPLVLALAQVPVQAWLELPLVPVQVRVQKLERSWEQQVSSHQIWALSGQKPQRQREWPAQQQAICSFRFPWENGITKK